MAKFVDQLRKHVRAGRQQGAAWARALDFGREFGSSSGRARLISRFVHGRRLQQLTEYTEPDRYPGIFNLAARQRPDAMRILSFGCSTEEEILALRSRFPAATIVGVEINARSRRIASQRFAQDPKVEVLADYAGEAPFDIVFAMAVLQFRPHLVQERAIQDLSSSYPFGRFDAEAFRLTEALRTGGLLCVMHAHYRVEDSSAADRLIPLPGAPLRTEDDLFDRSCQRYPDATTAGSMFVKV